LCIERVKVLVPSNPPKSSNPYSLQTMTFSL
jgi:hypothetical protein